MGTVFHLFKIFRVAFSCDLIKDASIPEMLIRFLE